VIGPLLRVAASAAAARSLRMAAHDAATHALLMLGAGAAIAVGAVCLTCAAFVLLERNIDPAGAWAIVGAFWALMGLFYFVATRRRRG
jgi:MYXO-CTERM domain-containing protein